MGFAYTAVCISELPLFYSCAEFCCMNMSVRSFIHSAANGHVCRFLVLATVTKAAVNMPRCLWVDMCVCKSLRQRGICSTPRCLQSCHVSFTDAAKHQSFKASGVRSAQTAPWGKAVTGHLLPAPGCGRGCGCPQLTTLTRGAEEERGGGDIQWEFVYLKFTGRLSWNSPFSLSENLSVGEACQDCKESCQ